VTEVSFLQNWSGTINGNQSFAAGESLGINVVVELQSYLKGFRYYRHSTASIDQISDFQVYKWSAGGLLSVVLHPSDNGSVGWHRCDLASPLLIPGGTEIQIAGFLPTGCHLDWNNGAVPTPPPGFSWFNGHHRMFQASSSVAFCPSGDNNFFYLIDPIFDTDAIVPAPSTSGDVTSAVDNGLADWLSEADHTHGAGDGMPYDTWQTGLDTNTKVSSGLNLAGGMQALSDSLAHTPQMASDYVAGRTATYFTPLKNRLIGASGGGGSAFFGPDGTQVSAGVEALLARSTNAQVGFPAAPWAKTAETDFDGCLAWDEPADLYTVAFATTPPTIPDNGQCGVPVRYRLAWWTPLNGDFAQERRWIDFEKAHLVNPAGRMPGLLLQTYLGGTGHVEAWTLNV